MKEKCLLLILTLAIVSTFALTQGTQAQRAPAVYDGLVYYYPGLLPHRDARMHSPYIDENLCRENDDYLVRGGDGILLLLLKKDLPPPLTCPDEGAAIVPNKPAMPLAPVPLLNIDYVEGLNIIQRQARPRIPISVLYSQGSEGLRITSNAGGSRNISLTGTNAINPDEGPVRWSKIREIFSQGAPLVFGDYKLYIALRPRDRASVLPGDDVDLYRSVKEEHVPDMFAYKGEHYTLKVDPSGFIWVPPISTSASSFRPSDWNNPRSRSLAGSNDQQNYWIKVFDSGKAIGEQPVLEEIGTCLTQACKPADAVDGKCFRPHLCLSLGIDDRFLPGTLLTREVRYQLLAGKRYWTLVDEQGRSFQQEYRAGERLVDAVQSAYRRATGGDLLQSSVRNHVYLIVAGNVSIPTEKQDVKPEPVFYGDVYFHRRSRLDDVLLLPRDRVFVSLTQPAKSL